MPHICLKMTPDAKSNISLAIAFGSLCISATLAAHNLLSARENVTLVHVGQGELTFRVNGIAIAQQIVITNQSTETVSILEGACALTSNTPDKYLTVSTCNFLTTDEFPIVIGAGEARAAEATVTFPTDNSILRIQAEWRSVHPEQTPMCFLSYLVEEYGVDYFGNDFARLQGALPKDEDLPIEITYRECGFSFYRLEALATHINSADQEENGSRWFEVSVFTARDKRFQSLSLHPRFPSVGPHWWD